MFLTRLKTKMAICFFKKSECGSVTDVTVGVCSVERSRHADIYVTVQTGLVMSHSARSVGLKAFTL